MPKTSQNLMAGAGVLAVSGLIAKVLSAVYRVPFQNLVGNTGFYVYQQVYPIYGIGMVLALSGWPLFISKIITEQPDEMHQQLVARRLFWSLFGISAVLFTIVYGGALVIADGWRFEIVPSCTRCCLDVLVHAIFGNRTWLCARTIEHGADSNVTSD